MSDIPHKEITPADVYFSTLFNIRGKMRGVPARPWMKARSVGNAFIDEFAQLVCKHGYREVKEYAAMMGLNNYQLRLRWQQHSLWKTPRKWINEYTRMAACELLEKTTLSCPVIGRRLGFTPNELFFRTFRRLQGCTPYEWREKTAFAPVFSETKPITPADVYFSKLVDAEGVRLKTLPSGPWMEARPCGNGFIDDFARLVCKHGNMTLKKYAAMMGLNYDQLKMQWRSLPTLKTPREWLSEYIHMAGRELLEKTDLSAVEIGKRLGYPDSSAFNRLFRILQGYTPTEWREKTASERKTITLPAGKPKWKPPEKVHSETKPITPADVYFSKLVITEGVRLKTLPPGPWMEARPAGNGFLDEFARLVCMHGTMGNGEIRKYSAMMGLNDYQLRLRWRSQSLWKTPNEWIDEYTCMAGRELLEKTDLTVTEISRKLGFTKIELFTHVFRSLQGCKPTEWRKKTMEVLIIEKQAFDELLYRLDSLKKKLDGLYASSGVAPQEWIDNPQACRILSASKRTLQKLRDGGILPFTKMGAKVFYKPEDIERMLQAGTNLKTEDDGQSR